MYLSPSQLAQDGMVNQSDARLLHELGERVRTLLDSYFRSPPGLFFSFTHLVCRTAITGIAPPLGPHRYYYVYDDFNYDDDYHYIIILFSPLSIYLEEVVVVVVFVR